MASNDIEIEIKHPLLNASQLVSFLDKNAQIKKKGVAQKDTYYIPPHRDFLSVQYPYEWLRLRETATSTSLDYKHFHPENALEHDFCDEVQTSIGDARSLRKIFAALNFQECIVVEKSRSTWILSDVEIAIDVVTDLGTYIELEAMGNFANPQDGKAHLRSVLEQIKAKVGEEELRGYAYILIDKSKNKAGTNGKYSNQLVPP